MGHTERSATILCLKILLLVFKIRVIDCSVQEELPPIGFKRILTPEDIAADPALARSMRLFEERLISDPPTQILLEDGTVVMCLNISNQLSLIDEPNATVPLKPSTFPLASNDTMPISDDEEQIAAATSFHSQDNHTCPSGTFPYMTSPSMEAASADPPVAPSPMYEQATGNLIRHSGGIQLTLDVRQPHLDKSNDFCLAQLRIAFTDGLNDTIEAGWQVNQELYRDFRAHLFVYWTRDGYGRTGCYNLQCPGFVQTSSTIVVGQPLSVSVLGGSEYTLNLLVYQEVPSNRWWLRVGTEHVGYWPSALFSNSLGDTSNRPDSDGQVSAHHSSPDRFTTDMGSGVFPDSSPIGRSTCVRKIKYVDLHNTPTNATSTTLVLSIRNCDLPDGG